MDGIGVSTVGLSGPTVSEAMVRFPKLCPVSTTVRQARAFFADDHVHALLVVEQARLVAVVERGDLVDVPGSAPAGTVGRLAGRVVGPDVDLAVAWRDMLARPVRRLAVVDGDGALQGLLCLKRSGRGFCSDDGVRARAAERGQQVG